MAMSRVQSAMSAARPQSSARPSTATARPFSSTNLSATVASSRFKTFAVQYEILRKNPVLCELAKDVPWKNLLDLFTLKFFAVGDVLWRHGEHPTELAFVLCGGFLARHMRVDPTNSPTRTPNSNTTNINIAPAESIIAEKLLKPGAAIALYAVDHTLPIRYSVVTAKFKSILLALPLGKYKSVLRQLSPETKASVRQLIDAQEVKLCDALQLAPPRVKSTALRATTAPTPLTKSVSAPTLAAARDTNSGVVHTASWDALQVSKPAEYEVNSSLLILHEPRSIANLHIPSSSHQSKTKLQRSASNSSLVRAVAKKHTTRRLSSIKLPAAIDAFPPAPRRLDEIEADALANANAASDGHVLDVVPKVRIGRLLAPIKKPVMVDANEAMVWSTAPTFHRPKLVLLADRIEQFREELGV